MSSFLLTDEMMIWISVVAKAAPKRTALTATSRIRFKANHIEITAAKVLVDKGEADTRKSHLAARKRNQRTKTGPSPELSAKVEAACVQTVHKFKVLVLQAADAGGYEIPPLQHQGRDCIHL